MPRTLPLVALAALMLWMPQALAEDEPAPTPKPYEPKSLASPLKDQGDAALNAGKREDAIALYLRWLEADPRDAGTRYNLACAYALLGKQEVALKAFEVCIDAGFKDLDHALRDSDLASIRSDARFAASIARGRKAAEAEGIPGMQRHALETQTVGTYIVLLPPDYAETTRTYPVVFILHGSGSSEVGHARVAEPLGREGVIYVAPRALHPHHGVFLRSGKPGWTAWPTDRIEPGAEAPDPMQLYTNWIKRCIDDVAKRYRMEGERVLVWGHSQGAGTANAFAALHPERVKSYFSYAGYYTDHVTDKALTNLAKAGVHVELCHGSKDNVVSPEGTRLMGPRLKQAGVSHVIHMVDAGHGISDEVRALSKAWLDAQARKKR